jgi:hypothetical protein
MEERENFGKCFSILYGSKVRIFFALFCGFQGRRARLEQINSCTFEVGDEGLWLRDGNRDWIL